MSHGSPSARGWMGASIRRRLLDADLEALAGHVEGWGLEIGGGRDFRRGRFQPRGGPWLSLDLQARPRPNVIGNAQRLPFAAAAFEAVLCSEVGEYLADPAQAVAEIARVLKPGGRLVWATPFMHRADSSSDRWRFTEAGLRQLLRDGGLTVAEVRTQGGALAVAANILRFAVMSIRRRALRVAVAALCYLPLRFMAAADGPATRVMPALATFSTGYAARATKPR